MSTVVLLWTGGWDSTFRLLQLLSDTNAQIQPLYLVDEQRESTPKEIEVMRDIRDDLEDRFPEASSRLLPTDYGSYRATQMEPHHKQAWEALKQRGRVGLQYPILASYAEQNDIARMELSVMRRTNEGFSIASLVKPAVVKRDGPAGKVPVLPEGQEGPEAMFERFTFPLLNYTKTEMRQEAKRRDWMPIMKKTWFCFNPIFGVPCGNCTPCKIASQEGMGSRVGLTGPFLSGIQDTWNRIEKYFRRLA